MTTKQKTKPRAKSKTLIQQSKIASFTQEVAKRKTLRRMLLMAVMPILIYFIFFCFYSWPWIIHFNTQFFTDQGDGFQNVWNVWWVNFSVTHLHQLPWQTLYLHYPYGTSLVGQTLNPFNGFVAIPLLMFSSLVQAFNAMVIFSFVASGLTMFWLCYFFTRKYIPSIIGGFIFTFSSYHFAHAIGHMQLVSLEWLPLFVLLWWQLMIRPRYRTAIAAVVVLCLVLFCDYYYFIYSVLTAIFITGYLWRRKELAPLKLPQTYRPLIVFSISAVLIVLPLPLALLYLNKTDPLLGSHPASIFSADPVNILLDGEFWRFSWLTKIYWGDVKAFTAEASIYLSVSVLVLLVIACLKRTKIHKNINFWIGIGLVFGILSLGPHLTIRGNTIDHAILPYSLLEKLVPDLRLSGVPIRMILMTIFASAIISAMVLTRLDLAKRKHQVLLALFSVVLFIELWPSTLPMNKSPRVYPAYVNTLKLLPGNSGVLDDGAATESWQLYDQTISEKPIVLGYISRTPTSVNAKDAVLVQIVSQGHYDILCSDYKVRYYTTPIFRPLNRGFPIVYRDKTTLIYDLKNSSNC